MTKFWSNFGQFLVKFWPGKTMKTQGGVPRILELVESWVLGIAVRNDQILVKFWSIFGQILAGQNYENTRRGTSNFGIGRILGFGNCPWAVCRGFGPFCKKNHQNVPKVSNHQRISFKILNLVKFGPGRY